MDVATLIGIFSGLAMVLLSISLGGNILNFLNLPGFLIVFGGTLASTFITFKFKDIRTAFKSAFLIFSSTEESPDDIISTMLKLSVYCHKASILSLNKFDTDSPFLTKVINLLMDRPNKELFLRTLRLEIESTKIRHYKVQNVFKKMGIYAPSFGMLGTLIGLVKLLVGLTNPSTIGPAMAIALLTTFYGVLLSTLVFLPIAGKLKERTMVEILNKEIMIESGVAILESVHPIMVYEKLTSFLPFSGRNDLKKNLHIKL